MVGKIPTTTHRSYVEVDGAVNGGRIPTTTYRSLIYVDVDNAVDGGKKSRRPHTAVMLKLMAQ
jgi:hypothetical protein